MGQFNLMKRMKNVVSLLVHERYIFVADVKTLRKNSDGIKSLHYLTICYLRELSYIKNIW